MAKRVRETGIPLHQARPGETLPHLRKYTGHQCPGCPLHGTCDPNPPPGGPWEVMEAHTDREVTCKVHPTIQMVPVRVRRIKQAREVKTAPRQEKKTEWHILLDANAIIEGAKGTFRGMIELLLDPPPGFHFYTTDIVADEVKHLRGHDPKAILALLTIIPSAESFHPALMETRGDDINPPSRQDASLFQAALDDAKFDILVSHDRFFRGTGLAHSLGISDRLTVYGVSDFVKYARRHR